MFEINLSDKQKIKINGQEYDVEEPSVDQYQALLARINSDEKGVRDEFKLLKDFVVDLGIPQEIAGKLKVGHIKGLIEHLTGSKKN